MRTVIMGMIVLVLQAAGALAQEPCNVACSADRAPFKGCQPSSLENPLKDRIGVVGRVRHLSLSPGCMGRASVEVMKASADGMPSQISVDYDPCERWGAHDGKVVDFYIWQRVLPSGAYSHAPCQGR